MGLRTRRSLSSRMAKHPWRKRLHLSAPRMDVIRQSAWALLWFSVGFFVSAEILAVIIHPICPQIFR